LSNYFIGGSETCAVTAPRGIELDQPHISIGEIFVKILCG
jgi:hypothetical protein